LFNPKQDNSYKICHSLVDLLNVLSTSFKRNFATIQRKRTQKHPFERIGTPYQVFSWLAPDFEHTVDWFRAEDSNASKLGHEDHIPGHSRDWNEEIQATRELPKKTLPERLIRERAMFKVHCDFVNAATRGAQLVVENNIMAINPGEEAKIQMFIWNNMFFSLGFDVKDHYKDLGGDHAAYVAPINDLKGVKALNLLDLDGLYTLGTVVIDYKGFRVTAQSIIPGILDKDQEQSVVHGSTDFGKTCVTHAKYNELLEKVAAHLKMRPHKIKVENNEEEILLYTSIECKGIYRFYDKPSLSSLIINKLFTQE
jgi:protein TIF31